MKKKKITVSMIFFIVAVVGYNIYLSKKNVSLSRLDLANMETLANDTESGNCDFKNGYTMFSQDNGGANIN